MWLLFLILLTEPPDENVLANAQGNPIVFPDKAICAMAAEAQAKALKEELASQPFDSNAATSLPSSLNSVLRTKNHARTR